MICRSAQLVLGYSLEDTIHIHHRKACLHGEIWRTFSFSKDLSHLERLSNAIINVLNLFVLLIQSFFLVRHLQSYWTNTLICVHVDTSLYTSLHIMLSLKCRLIWLIQQFCHVQNPSFRKNPYACLWLCVSFNAVNDDESFNTSTCGSSMKTSSAIELGEIDEGNHCWKCTLNNFVLPKFKTLNVSSIGQTTRGLERLE